MKLVTEMAFSVIGGLGIFLLGMKHMSEGVQAIAGERLRRMIGAVTDNRVLATMVGTGVTVLVQSSSVTTVLVVGLVNAGVMALHQAIGVIMGANIGTTITGWILVLKIGKYGLPILGVASFVFMFAKRDRLKYIAMSVMGVGMVFYGLALMKNGFAPIKKIPEFEQWFAMFQADSYLGVLKCAVVGCVLTMVVQSSSATLGITIGLASTGVIQFETAAALVMGENIGTTITAALAALNATTVARRAAAAHVMFNMLGFLWITLVFGVYLSMIQWGFEHWVGHAPQEAVMENGEATYPYAVGAIATVHTVFNVANTLMFLPFVRVFARFLERVMPGGESEKRHQLTQLDVHLIETPMLGIERSREEILHMARDTSEMMDRVKALVAQDDKDADQIKKVFKSEKRLDRIESEIVEFLTDFLSNDIPHSLVDEGRQHLRISDEYESASDAIASVLKNHLKLRDAELSLTAEQLEELGRLHDAVATYVSRVNKALENRDHEGVEEVRSEAPAITKMVREFRDRHLERLSSTDERVPPLVSVTFVALLSDYRRIKDHAKNIADCMVGGR